MLGEVAPTRTAATEASFAEAGRRTLPLPEAAAEVLFFFFFLFAASAALAAAQSAAAALSALLLFSLSLSLSRCFSSHAATSLSWM